MTPTKARSPSPKASSKKASASGAGSSPSELIDARIRELQDWRGKLLAALRTLIRGVDPAITEEWKWNTPVWSCNGIVCTGESYKKVVKLTFARGASLADPSRLFNSSLQGRLRRAIDFPEGSRIDESALQDLIRAAVALNGSAADDSAKGTA